MTANCFCDINFLQYKNSNNIKKEEKIQVDKINFDSITKSFISNLYDFNFEVMKCYNLILNIKVLKINMGFYFMISAFFLQIIFWIIYEIKRLKNIQYYMILFQTKDKKNNLLLSSSKNNDKSKYEERENNKDKIYKIF